MKIPSTVTLLSFLSSSLQWIHSHIVFDSFDIMLCPYSESNELQLAGQESTRMGTTNVKKSHWKLQWTVRAQVIITELSETINMPKRAITYRLCQWYTARNVNNCNFICIFISCKKHQRNDGSAALNISRYIFYIVKKTSKDC